MAVPTRAGRRVPMGLVLAALPASLLLPPSASAAPGPRGVEAAAVASPAQRASAARTSTLEARRVGRVPKPTLRWASCYQGRAQCATVKLPLDYDAPKGAKVSLAVLRVKARDQKRRIGSLFVNPGGPGGSGTAMALAGPQFLGNEVLDRFDIVGFDPRGVAFSANVRCFRTVAQQEAALKGQNVFFPLTAPEERAYIASSKALGKACSSKGKPLSASMSTAEAARDMDVLRRAVGDKKLSYLGFSYGSALGQYYANMFPDRFRALAIDGAINPVAWVGTAATSSTIQDDRLRSADGAYKALREILTRCTQAGVANCALAQGDALENFDAVARRLRTGPLVLTDPEGNEVPVTYADFVGLTLGDLYSPDGYVDIVQRTVDLLALIQPPAVEGAPQRAARAQRVLDAVHAMAGRRARAPQEYDNGVEAYSGVACTDGLHPKDASLWPAKTAAADLRAPYFGRAWGWSTSQCARNTWKARDEDAYKGPFTRRTKAPVLVVGNYFDPATNYADAVKAAKLLPNSRLLSSDNFGHTAYGTSTCATSAIDRYLLRGTLPAKGTVCKGDVQPYGAPAAAAAGRERLVAALDASEVAAVPAGSPKTLPPVVTVLQLWGFAR